MQRYSLIKEKMPREFLLLQGTGCRWAKCTFCDYFGDCSSNPYEVNKKVLEVCGIDSDEYSGFAFGIGIERTAMLKYGINNIKLLFESDVKVLGQLNDK